MKLKGHKIYIEFVVDFIFSYYEKLDSLSMWELYCLGYLEDNKWKCKYWNVKSSKWMMGFDVTEDGTYAVIFYPTIDVS